MTLRDRLFGKPETWRPPSMVMLDRAVQEGETQRNNIKQFSIGMARMFNHKGDPEQVEIMSQYIERETYRLVENIIARQDAKIEFFKYYQEMLNLPS